MKIIALAYTAIAIAIIVLMAMRPSTEIQIAQPQTDDQPETTPVENTQTQETTIIPSSPSPEAVEATDGSTQTVDTITTTPTVDKNIAAPVYPSDIENSNTNTIQEEDKTDSPENPTEPLTNQELPSTTIEEEQTAPVTPPASPQPVAPTPVIDTPLEAIEDDTKKN